MSQCPQGHDVFLHSLRDRQGSKRLVCRNARKGMMSFSTRWPICPSRKGELCNKSQCPQGHDVFLHLVVIKREGRFYSVAMPARA